MSIANQVNLTGIRYDELCSITCCLFYIHGDYRVSYRGVGTDSQDTTGFTDVANRVSHRPAAECGDQTGHRRGMSETGTVVYIIRTQY